MKKIMMPDDIKKKHLTQISGSNEIKGNKIS